MSGITERSGRLRLLHLFRLGALFVLSAGWYLYFRSLVSPLFWIPAFLLGAGWALFSAERLRFFPALGSFLLLIFLVRGAAFLAFRLAGEGGDVLHLFFDVNYLPLLIPLGVSWGFTYAVRRRPELTLWETAVNAWLLLLLFWSQGHYRLTLVAHPVILAAGTVLFLCLEVGVMVLHASAPGGPGRREAILFSLLFLTLLAGGSFLFLGRFSQGAVARGGGLVKPTLFRFDFSRYVQLESEITMSSDLVLLYREEEPVEERLLRRFVLSGYRPGQGFFLQDPPGGEGREELPTAIPDRRILLEVPEYWGRMDAVQEYYFVNFDPSSLVALNYPVEIIPLNSWENSPFLRNYRVRSRVAGFLTWELLDSPSGDLAPDLEAFYTDYGGDERVRTLAETVAGDLDNYYDRVMAVQAYLLDNFWYSLKPGVATDGNQLHHFLFESRKGYCSYFAFSMALMCRSLGIPARVAVGFYADPSLGVMNIYPVRADMAHAWVEVYFPDYGWINFDPTSRNPAPGEDLIPGGLELDRFLSLVEEILANRSFLSEEVPREELARPASLWNRLWRELAGAAARWWYLALPGLWLAFLGIRWGLLPLRELLARDPRRKTFLLFRRFRRQLDLRGLGSRPGESLLEWARRLGGEGYGEIEPVTRIYLQSRYGHRFTSSARRAARAGSRRVLRKLRRQVFPALPLRFLIQPFRRRV